MKQLPRIPAHAGRVNPARMSPMEWAMFEAEIERRPYTFLGAYFRAMAPRRRPQ